MTDEELFNIKPEEINAIANELAKILESTGIEVEAIAVPYVPIEEINLEELSTSVAGITDIWGQISEAIKNLFQSIASWIVDSVTGFVEGIKEKILGAIEGIKSWFQDTLNNIFSSLSSVKDTLSRFVWEPFQNLLTAFQDFLRTLPDKLSGIGNLISDAINTVRSGLDYIGQVLSNIPSKITELFNNVKASFEGLGESIRNAFSFVINSLGNVKDAFSHLSDMLKGAFDTFLSKVQDFGKMLGQIPNLISQGIEQVKSLFGNIGSMIMNALSRLGDLGKFISDLFGKVGDWFRDVGAKFSGFIEKITSAITNIPNLISGAINKISGFINTVISRLKDIGATISDIPKKIGGVINTLLKDVGRIGEFIGKMFESISQIPEKVSGVINVIIEKISGIGEVVSKNIETIVNAFKNLPETVREIIDKLGETISKLGEKFKPLSEGLEKIREGVSSAIETVKKLPEIVSNLPSIIAEKARNLPKWVFDNLPDWAKNAIIGFQVNIVNFIDTLNKIREMFANVPKQIEDFVKTVQEAFETLKDPSKLMRTLADKVMGALSWLANKVAEGAKWLVDRVKDVANILGKAIITAIEKIASFFGDTVLPALAKVCKTIIDVAKGAFKKVRDVFLAPYSILIEEPMKWYQEMIKEVGSGKAVGEFELIYKLISVIFLGNFILYFITQSPGLLARLLPRLEASLTPIFARLGIRIDLMHIAYSITEFLEKTMPDVYRYVMIGNMIWWFEPSRVVTRSILTDYITVELPPLNLMIEAVRRRILKGNLKELAEKVIWQLRLGGIYKEFARFFYEVTDEFQKDFLSKLGATEDIVKSSDVYKGAKMPYFSDVKLGIVVQDRFLKERLFPANLIFQLPSRTELARWLVRDVFYTPMHYEYVAMAVGVHPDIAKMQYMYSFEYPPPEKLWKFVMRGISGLLWFRPPKDVFEAFKAEARWLGAGVPKSPVELNRKAEILFKALNWYMKWRQYSNFSWFVSDDPRVGSEFTADSWLVLDVTADIPGKIDIRWMTKWAILEEISKKLAELYGKDVYHKLYNAVDLTSIIKEGASTNPVKMDLTLMCSLLQATGLHPYYVPIVAVAEAMNALSDERTLLRTGFIDLYREGAFTVDTLEKLLEGFVIASFDVAYFNMQTYDWVKGHIDMPVRFLPAERKLLELRAVMDRARTLLREFLTEVRYAIRDCIYDVNKAKEEIEGMINNINTSFFAKTVEEITGKELKLTLDTGWINSYTYMAERMAEIHAYHRTRYYSRYLLWSMIRLIREGYITKETARKFIDDFVAKIKEHKLVKGVFEYIIDTVETLKVNEIMVRSILNKVRTKRMTIEEAKNKLVEYGIDKDIVEDFITANVALYHPSLTMYGTLLEVVPEAYGMAVKALKYFNLPEDEVRYWTTYIVRKPFADELTLLRTRIYNALAVGATPETVLDILKSYLIVPEIKGEEVEWSYGDKAKELADFYSKNKDVFHAFGITEQEWIMYNLISEFERLIRTYREAERERIPTPSTLATLSEYVLIPEEKIREALKAYGVPEDWFNIWLQYIKRRPLYSDYRSLLTAYMRALIYKVITEEEFNKFIEKIKQYGWTDEEINAIRERIDLEVKIREFEDVRRAHALTPQTLATIAELVELSDKLIETAFKARGITEDIKDVWLKYVALRPLSDELRLIRTRIYNALSAGATVSDIIDLLSKYALIMEINGYKVSWKYGEVAKKLVEIYSRNEAVFKAFGISEQEWVLFNLISEFEKLIDSLKESVPAPSTLATMAEYIVIPDELIKEALKERRIRGKWFNIYYKYIKVRPISDDVRRLINTYYRGLRYVTIPKEIENKVKYYMKLINFTETEQEVYNLANEIEALIDSAREYIPTPRSIATIAEYVPYVKGLLDKSFERHRVPEEWRKVWEDFVNIRPVVDDVRLVESVLRRMAGRFVISIDTYTKLVSALAKYGFTTEEVAMRRQAVVFERMYRAFMELIGSPRRLVTMAEYSPTARGFALSRVQQMIDALPVDTATKNLLKKMWEEFIRNRPVYDEVRRYITELISDYAEGVIDRATLERELNELKKWGVDDYEIKFYLWLAEKRKVRRALRYARY